MSRKDSSRGKNARKVVPVLLSAGERREIERALAWENRLSGADAGLGTKLRELGLKWARSINGSR